MTKLYSLKPESKINRDFVLFIKVKMESKTEKKQIVSILSIFIVAFLVALVGFYTENNGFVVAGGIFLLVGVVMGIKHITTKNSG